MSEHSRALENAASRDLLAFARGPTAQLADNVVWRLAEYIISKVNENVMGELATVRRVADAHPDETTVKAVKRLIHEKDGVIARYRSAQREWRSQRAMLVAERDRLREALLKHIAVFGGADHHPDDCEASETCVQCQTIAVVEAALERLDAQRERGEGE